MRYDAPRFLGSIFRFEVRLEFRREKFAPFLGFGNEAASDFDPVADVRTRFYSWDRLAFGGWVRARAQAPWGWPIEPWFGLGYRQTRVRAYAGSLLEARSPAGIEGGRAVQALLGLIHDTRDDEAAPTRGGSQEIALRLAPAFLGSTDAFGQLTLSARHFFSLAQGLVLGGRAMGDWIFGNPPFFELPYFGGIPGAEGLGGISSIRGLDRHRYVGALKFLFNLELRATVWEPSIFGHAFQVGAVVFADLGRVWQPGTASGPWHRFHPSTGLGLRIVKGAAVLRFDYGISLERQSIYLIVGNMF